MSRRRLLPIGVLGLLVVVALAAGLGAARGPDPKAVPTAEQVDSRTMSPFCTGLTLAACPSSQASELRKTIAGMIAQGKTNRQIDAWLLANYPATVIGAPRNVLAWVVPAAVALAGLAVVAAFLLRRPGRSISEAEPVEEVLPAISDSDHARLGADLRRFAEGLSD